MGKQYNWVVTYYLSGEGNPILYKYVVSSGIVGAIRQANKQLPEHLHSRIQSTEAYIDYSRR